MFVLVCNVGSTSLKFKLFDFPSEEVLFMGKIERIGEQTSPCSFTNLKTNTKKTTTTSVANYVFGIRLFLDELMGTNGVINEINDIKIVGFKTVISKGYTGVHIIDENVEKGMEEYLDIAKVHNGSYLAAIRAMKSIIPNAKMVGVFETSFHQTIRKEKYTYSIPLEWSEKYGIRKFGYHGSSHEYSSTVIRKEYGPNIRHISLHLGGSSSICAIYDGRSVDSSFSMSLQTGLMHANRCGDVDSFIFPMLINRGLKMEEVEETLASNSGLKGIYGTSGDLRDITEAISNGDKRAKLAIDMFVYGIVKYVGSFYALLGGLDVLTFTGGIGENSSLIRQMICDQLSCFGITLDGKKNNANVLGKISTNNSKVIIKTIACDEEIIVARKAYKKVYGN